MLDADRVGQGPSFGAGSFVVGWPCCSTGSLLGGRCRFKIPLLLRQQHLYLVGLVQQLVHWIDVDPSVLRSVSLVNRAFVVAADRDKNLDPPHDWFDIVAVAFG